VNVAASGRDGAIVFKIREQFATHSVERRMVDGDQRWSRCFGYSPETLFQFVAKSEPG
jgi:hypothetical protein